VTRRDSFTLSSIFKKLVIVRICRRNSARGSSLTNRNRVEFIIGKSGLYTSEFVVREARDTAAPFRCSCLWELLRNSISSARQSVLLADGISSAVKSARAPRRLENVRNRRDGAAAKYDSSSPNVEENFGWWLSDREIVVSPRSHRVKDHRSPGSSILSRIHSNDSGSCSFARDISRQKRESGICEKIELNLFTRDTLDIDLIERDACETVSVTSY